MQRHPIMAPVVALGLALAAASAELSEQWFGFDASS